MLKKVWSYHIDFCKLYLTILHRECGRHSPISCEISTCKNGASFFAPFFKFTCPLAGWLFSLDKFYSHVHIIVLEMHTSVLACTQMKKAIQSM